MRFPPDMAPPGVDQTADTGSTKSRAQLIEDLRQRIDAISAVAPAGTDHLTVQGTRPPGRNASQKVSEAPWLAIGIDGLNEVKPLNYPDTPAAVLFAQSLLIERTEARHSRPWLLVATAAVSREIGMAYGPGLADFGAEPARLLLVEARSHSDGVAALEEGLRSGALAGVLGLLDQVSVTEARRLQLAADGTATPCLLVSGHKSPPASVARNRWRVATRPSAPHPFDPRAPGRRRWQLTLERSQRGPAGRSWSVEWCDEARRLCLSPELAGRAAHPEKSASSAS